MSKARGNGVGRLLAAALALLLADYATSIARNLLGDGLPVTAALLVAASGAALVFLIVLAAEPGAALHPRVPLFRELDGRKSFDVAAAALMTLTLWAVAGLGILVDPARGIELWLRHGVGLEESQSVGRGALLIGLAFNVLLFVGPVVAWERARTGTDVAAFHALGLPGDRPWHSALVGGGVAIAVIAAIGAVAGLAAAAGFAPPENERALAMARALDVPTALLASFGAAVSEEVLFRGFLLPRVGLLGQALLFTGVHLGFLNVVQIVLTFAVGLLLGVVRMRTRSLVGPIALHFTFNALMFLAVILGPAP